eukprot:XP_002515945.2 uncharacterized protein LOC8273760 [Ricinus communis]
MQFIDMKAMKSLYNHKTLFFSYPIKAPNQHCSFHFRSPQFHSTALRFLAGGSVDPSTGSDSSDKTQNAPQVWSFYNPLTSTIETQRSTNNSNSSNNKNDQESVPGLSNLKIRVSDNESEILNNRDINKMGLTRYSNENEELINEKRYASLKKADLVDNIVSNNNRKKGRSKVIYVCESCGNEDGQWWGICRSCGKAGTMKQFSDRDDRSGNSRVSGAEVTENMVRSWLPQKVSQTQPLRLKDVNQRMNQLNWRIPLPGLFGSEVARVLGGGVVPGSLILIGGDPGVGKSTLLLQVAAIIAEGQDVGKRDPVVYVSGEESVEQIVNRADRLSIGVEELFLYSSTDIELVGHVTKSGDIAGPRVLEHIVDVVLYLEGEKHSTHRLLRPVKNRFGSTDELGVFEMSQSGLQSVSNPSEIFLSEQYLGSEVLVGLAVAVIMDGSRSFLIEIQALCATGSSVSRHVNGIQANRADMIISVLKKQAGLMLQDNDIFLNVVSGVTLTETAGDLAIAAAICSSFLEFPIPNNVAFIGEIGLGGELRTVPRMEKRVHTVAKLGYKMCIVPKSANKYLSNLAFEGIQIIGCANLRQVIDAVFTKQR